jgi:hypothetical protein
MNFYKETTYNGELWLRDTNDNVVSANSYLSAIYEKYNTFNDIFQFSFYGDLALNIIKKFDVFYDCFLIQTNNGFIFEKYKVQDLSIVPFTQINNYYRNSYLDYWFDETKKKVYFITKNETDFSLPEPQNNKAYVKLAFTFNVFDIKTGKISILMNELLNFNLFNPINLSKSNGIFEDPKLTYNPDTNNFNISVIIRNDVNEMGLLSINLNEFEIKEVNSFIPFGTLALPEEIIAPTATPTPTPTVTQFLTPTPTPTPTITNSSTPIPSQTPTPTSTPPATQAVRTLYISFE